MNSFDSFVHPFAEVALSNITRDYPFASHHLARSAADIVPAAEKNPAFANSFDWHSSVHMHYLLASLLGTEEAQDASWRDRALDVLSSHLSAENMLAEAAFLRENPSWERPYGWAWAVELDRVLNASSVAELQELGTNARVLAETVFDLVSAWLRKVAEPVRHGVHSNTAFGLRRILVAPGRQTVTMSSMSSRGQLADSSPRMPPGISYRNAAVTTSSPPACARPTSWPKCSPTTSWQRGCLRSCRSCRRSRRHSPQSRSWTRPMATRVTSTVWASRSRHR